VKPGFLISQFFITFILLSSLACTVKIGGVFYDGFPAISFFEDFSQAFSPHGAMIYIRQISGGEKL
jgi:hypothetical protein